MTRRVRYSRGRAQLNPAEVMNFLTHLRPPWVDLEADDLAYLAAIADNATVPWDSHPEAAIRLGLADDATVASFIAEWVEAADQIRAGLTDPDPDPDYGVICSHFRVWIDPGRGLAERQRILDQLEPRLREPQEWYAEWQAEL